jgi:hypothetical protein
MPAEILLLLQLCHCLAYAKGKSEFFKDRQCLFLGIAAGLHGSGAACFCIQPLWMSASSAFHRLAS